MQFTVADLRAAADSIDAIACQPLDQVDLDPPARSGGPHEARAEMVRRIFREYLDGKGDRAVVNLLTWRGFLSAPLETRP